MATNIKLTFKEGRRLEFEDYSIGVPDGFEYKTNVNGRDFVIWMKPPMGARGADVITKDGYPEDSMLMLMHLPSEEMDMVYSQNEVLNELYHKKSYMYYLATQMMQDEEREEITDSLIMLQTKEIPAMYFGLKKTDVPQIIRTEVEGKHIISVSTGPVYYMLELSFANKMKSFNCMAHFGGETELFEKTLCTWIDTIKLKEPYQVRKPLDDISFFPKGLTKKAIYEWRKYAARWMNEDAILCHYGTKYEICLYASTHDTFSLSACRPKIVKHITEEANAYNQMMEEMLSCIEKFRGSAPEDKFTYLCQAVLELAEDDYSYESVEGNKIEVATNAAAVRKKIESIMANGDSAEDAPVKQVKKQTKEQAAEPAASEAKEGTKKKAKPTATEETQIKKEQMQRVKETIKNLKDELQQRLNTLRKEEAERVVECKKNLEQAIKKEMEWLEEELVRVKKESEATASELDAMGLFQFKQKAEAKAKLQQLQAKIGELERERQDPNFGEISKAKAALKNAEEIVGTFEARKDKWEAAMQKVCDEYEERTKLHFDYIAGKKMKLKSKMSAAEKRDYEIMMHVKKHTNLSPHRFKAVSAICDEINTEYPWTYSKEHIVEVIKQMLSKGYVVESDNIKLVWGGSGTMYVGAGNALPLVIDDTAWDINQLPAAPTLKDVMS